MNKSQVKALQALIDKIVPMVGELEEAISQVEPMADDHRSKFDGMSERAQEGDKGQLADRDATNLEEVRDELTTARDSLDQAMNAATAIVEESR